MPFSLVFQQLFATFAGDLVMYQVFHRCIKGNQVQILSSTRYCHLHYGKSMRTTEQSGRRAFRREPGNLPKREQCETCFGIAERREVLTKGQTCQRQVQEAKAPGTGLGGQSNKRIYDEIDAHAPVGCRVVCCGRCRWRQGCKMC